MTHKPTLEALLAATRDHVMSPQEVWDQRASFVYGQMLDRANPPTRAEVEALLAREYGPRPGDER